VGACALEARAARARLAQSGATGFREEAFTIGFARRSTAYKRSTLLFHDPARLLALAQKHGPLQLVFAARRIRTTTRASS